MYRSKGGKGIGRASTIYYDLGDIAIRNEPEKIEEVMAGKYHITKTGRIKWDSPKCEVNDTFTYDYTPLMLASIYGNIEFVKEIVEKYGADTTIKTEDSNRTAYDLAKRLENEKIKNIKEVIEYLEKFPH